MHVLRLLYSSELVASVLGVIYDLFFGSSRLFKSVQGHSVTNSVIELFSVRYP